MPVSRYYDVKRDAEDHRYLEVRVTGSPLLHLPLLNKSTAFSTEERRALGLDGLLPPHVSSMDEQKERAYRRFRAQPTDLEKHVTLRNMQDHNEVMFYALVAEHLEEMLPILYTPTVGEAVREFSRTYRYPRGLCLSTDNLEWAPRVLSNVPLDDVRMIVATDSSAILGLGDQGFGGMAISIGKLSLYTVAGGVGPDKTLPVELDVGTERPDLREDPLYLGVRHPRLTGAEYDAFLDRFVEAAQARYPKAIIQWEDFSKDTAFRVLERYRDRVASFNDDIQGTGAMALAGLLRACALRGEQLVDQTFVVVGAGAGGIGVAWAITQGLIFAGLDPDAARARVLVVDRQGLLIQGQPLEAHHHPYAQAPERAAGWACATGTPSLLETVRCSGATVLLGLSGVPGLFTQPVVEAMGANTARPVIFALSNPTTNAELLPEDALRWTGGRAIVATGSPSADVQHAGLAHQIGQGNNAFIFPGLGFGAVIARAARISDRMVLAAAYALADYTAAHCPARTYPPVSALREASLAVAARVARAALDEGVAQEPDVAGMDDAQLLAFLRSRFWTPKYLPYQLAEGAGPDFR